MSTETTKACDSILHTSLFTSRIMKIKSKKGGFWAETFKLYTKEKNRKNKSLILLVDLSHQSLFPH